MPLSVSVTMAGKIIVCGTDPQTTLKNSDLQHEGAWTQEKDASSISGSIHLTDTKDASVTAVFQGNQIRVGRADQFGGQADVFIDGIKQIVYIDF